MDTTRTAVLVALAAFAVGFLYGYRQEHARFVREHARYLNARAAAFRSFDLVPELMERRNHHDQTH